MFVYYLAHSFLDTEGGEVEAVRKEIVILRQGLSDRDETIMDLEKQIEASEATIMMLKEKVQHLSSQILSAENVMKEPSMIQPKVEQPSFQLLEPGSCYQIGIPILLC